MGSKPIVNSDITIHLIINIVLRDKERENPVPKHNTNSNIEHFLYKISDTSLIGVGVIAYSAHLQSQMVLMCSETETLLSVEGQKKLVNDLSHTSAALARWVLSQPCLSFLNNKQIIH